MKKLFTVTLFLILLFLLLTLTSRADTEEKSSASQYTVTGADGEYALTLRQGGSSTFVASGTLGDILPLVLGELVFDSVTTDERIELPEGSYKVSGTLFSSGGITVSSGTDLILSGINLTLTDGASLRVKGGRLTVESSRVSSEGVTVTLDYMASSRLTLLSGELCSLGAAPAVEIKSGEAKLLGGSTVSLGGAAVRCESHLTLAGSSALSGIGYDIITSRPVSLGEGSSSYSGDGLSVSYLGELTKGTMTELFYEAGAEHSELISLYDSQGREYELTYFESYSGRDERNFLAVYLPHTVRIYLGNTLIETQLRLSGEPVKLPEPEERCGYTHKGWYTDREGVSPYPTDTAVLADTEIYSLYRLTPPEFSVKSYLASYTGRAHTVTFDKLTHPLDSSGGSYTLAWYKDGELVGEGRELTVSSVSDSGVYSCSITYRYSTDSVTVTAENISVTIEKAVVALPIIEESRYTGSPQAPKVPVSDEYSVELPTATDAGSYPVIFTLTDPDNYRFSETDAAVSSLDYRILKADNLWTKELSVYDTYFGAELDVSASSLFGKVSFEYLSLGGEWTPEPPKTAGDYLVRAVVKGTENYSELTSDPKALTLLPDAVRTLSAISAPNKTSYTAYEMFNPDGIILLATYYSGRAEEINSSAFSVTYQQGDGFRFGDNAVILSFGGVGCAVPVTVTKASYDLTGLIFTDLTVVYNGAYQTLPAPDREIIGADGLALKYSVTGGGCAVGEYTVTLSFLCDSLECELPAPITAKLTIIPYMAEITWQNTEFIYDGTAKLPTATYVDIYGVARVAGAVGEKVNAGGPYLATAYVDDPNYILISSEATFTIDRAYYDFSSVSWSADSFVFSGSEYSVTLSGLPEGVTVAGYTDGRATTAGEYTAVATLSYDVENYYPPEPLRHVWTIERATYDLGSIRFESVTVVYDGELHYPTLSGEIPCGADGITPTYTLSSGASHVSEGEHTVTLTFSTESPNYLTPEPLYATVTVLPLGIYVSWSADTLVYSGGNLCPTAFASETAVSVSGGAIDSGSYLAYAEAVNTDYYVINAEYPFVIGKAQNGWHIPLFIDSIYASGTLLPRAEAVFGDCTVAYYSDPECTEIIPEPTEAGIYYAVATVEESRNYLPLTSSPVRFEILPVLPVSLSASITAERLVAFDVLTDDKLRVTVTYNDGASLALSTSEFSVIYFSGDSLRRTDTSVTLVFGELTLDLPVSVDYAEYDLSLVRWENTVTYYDGTPKTPELIGLPEGITVTGYSQSPTAAGEYAVYAYLSYDSENYRAPSISECSFTVKRCVVNIPVIPAAEYSGEPYIPVTYSPLYFFENIDEQVLAGEYTLTATLIDPSNYVFDSGEVSSPVTYRILPRTVEVEVLDYDLYLFESMGECDFVISEGSVLDGDELLPVQYVEDGKIYLRSGNPNYTLKVSAGTLNRLGYPSPELTSKLVIGFIFLVALGLLILIIYVERERILDTVAIARYKLKTARSSRSSRSADSFGDTAASASKVSADGTAPVCASDVNSPKDSETGTLADTLSETDEPLPEDDDIEIWEPEYDPQAEPELVKEYLEGNDGDIEEPYITLDESDLTSSTGVDVARAEELITDSLAKDLLKRSREAVYTDGDGRSIINVDTLSATFSAGDRVDVNILKQKSLVPYDTAYLKVLARGVIDKPLSVYANDFSLAAVKMIALTGGEAIRVVTLKRKSDGKEQ